MTSAQPDPEKNPNNALNHVIEFINNEFDDKVALLGKSKDIYSKLSQKKQDIETKLSIASNEVPSKLSQVLVEVESILTRLEEVKNLQDELDSQVSVHLARVGPIVNDLNQPIEEISLIERYIHYLQWIQTVHDLSSEIQTALLVKSENRAVSYYCQLVNLQQTLKNSNCRHLVSFIKVTVQFWYQLLKDRFSREFEDLLKSLKWPFLPPFTIDSMLRPDADVYARFEALFTYLIHLQHSDELSSEDTKTLSSLYHFEPIALPLQLLLKSLQKRFKFHFYGSKETNNLKKPEWFFTQVLNWIRDHAPFLEQKVQPILNKEENNYIDAKIEFTRGLIQLVMEKLSQNIENILYDDILLSHTIDETLLFDKEIRGLGYPSHYPSCLLVLTQEHFFTRWINMERNFAVEKMDVIMSAPTAWKPRFEDHGDIDEYRVPECGENFMTLILTITDRYKALPLPGHRLQFLDLQLELLDDFRMRLQQLHKEDAKEPLDSNYCPILNTINYVVYILKEWSDLPFFVRMQYYKLQYEQATQTLLRHQHPTTSSEFSLSAASSFEEDSETFLVSSQTSSTALQKEALESLQEDFETKKIDEMIGTIFDKIIEIFEHMKDDMIRKLVEFAVSEVKAKSKPYRNEKWFSMPSADEFINLSVTPSACSMLMILKLQLHSLKELLAQPLYEKLWQMMAEELDYYLYHELIRRNHFNDGGCAQINHDMIRNFFPIFGEYTRRPENYFKRVKEACALLMLPKGSALLLQDALNTENKMAIRNRESFSENALVELGIYKLTPKHACEILSLRTDLKIL